MALGGIARIGQMQLLQPFVALAAAAVLLGETRRLAGDRLFRPGGRAGGAGLAHARRALALMSRLRRAGAAVPCQDQFGAAEIERTELSATQGGAHARGLGLLASRLLMVLGTAA